MTDTTKPAQAEVSHISGEMLTAVGRTLSRRVSFRVSWSDIRRWALAVYHPDAPPERFIEWEELRREVAPRRDHRTGGLQPLRLAGGAAERSCRPGGRRTIPAPSRACSVSPRHRWSSS